MYVCILSVSEREGEKEREGKRELGRGRGRGEREGEKIICTLGHPYRFRSVSLRLVSWWTLTWLQGTLSTRRYEMHSWPSTTIFLVDLFLKTTNNTAVYSTVISSPIEQNRILYKCKRQDHKQKLR